MAPRQELRDAHEDIMKSVTGHENEPDDDDHGGEGLELDNEEQLDLGDTDDDADDGQQRSKPDDGDDADDGQDQQRQRRDPDDDVDDQQRQRPTGSVDDDTDQDFRYSQDRKGNLLDRDGRILFPVGRSRNAWSKLKKAYATGRSNNVALVQHAQKLASAGSELLQRYNKLKETANPGATKGLTEQENREAVDLMALAKLDPKAAIRSILTKVHMSGVDLSELGVTGPVDAKEIARHTVELQEAARTKRENERQTSLREEARVEAHDFLVANPAAVRYQGMIADAKQRFPHMKLQDIWDQLVRSAREHANKQQNGRGRDQRNGDGRQLREPPPRNGSRDRRSDGKLSMKAVDPTQSFKQIGADLLSDLQKLEQG